jgi:hypothetical protein
LLLQRLLLDALRLFERRIDALGVRRGGGCRCRACRCCRRLGRRLVGGFRCEDRFDRRSDWTTARRRLSLALVEAIASSGGLRRLVGGCRCRACRRCRRLGRRLVGGSTGGLYEAVDAVLLLRSTARRRLVEASGGSRVARGFASGFASSRTVNQL